MLVSIDCLLFVSRTEPMLGPLLTEPDSTGQHSQQGQIIPTARRVGTSESTPRFGEVFVA